MRVKVRDLRVGDGVDLLTFPAGYPFGEMTRHVAEFETAEVLGLEDGAVPEFVKEAEGCWVLPTSEGDFGIDPDWEVEVQRS